MKIYFQTGFTLIEYCASYVLFCIFLILLEHSLTFCFQQFSHLLNQQQLLFEKNSKIQSGFESSGFDEISLNNKS